MLMAYDMTSCDGGSDMNIYDLYKQKLTSAEDAVLSIRSGEVVAFGQLGSCPKAICEAMPLLKGNAKHVRTYLPVTTRHYTFMTDPAYADTFDHTCGFMMPSTRAGYKNHLVSPYPNDLHSGIDRWIEHNGSDVFIVGVAPMDEHGYFCMPLSLIYERNFFETAKRVIVEVNPRLPRIWGDTMIHVSEVDMIVEGPHGPLPSVKSPAANEAEMKIAEYVVQNMVDGSTLQLGIGSLPNAVGQMIARSDLRDLGIHTEMLCDSYLDMYKAGKINNKRKTLDRYKSVFGFAIGSEDLYDWVRENPGVVTYPISYCMAAPISYTNDVRTIAAIDNFVSINNCISVDLYGQICAESAGTRQISGTGGQLDFLESAAVSKGGKAFICMTSSFTNKEGETVSRINPLLTPGDIVTDPRSLAYYVVTEYGGVNLVGCSTWERAEKLISIAHPKFRDELIASAEKQGIWLRSNKR